MLFQITMFDLFKLDCRLRPNDFGLRLTMADAKTNSEFQIFSVFYAKGNPAGSLDAI
jgi:hypothetical protein